MMKNPLLWLELRIRIRERKLWVISLLYLLCLFAMSLVPQVTMIDQPYQGSVPPAQIGGAMFVTSIFTLMALLLIISPLSSAGAISQEREQRTLPGLLNTPLSSSRIAFGKLLATWIFIVWLLALSSPFLLLDSIWCGISWGEIFSAFGIILAAGMVTSTIALGMSGYFKRTVTSYVATGTLFFLWLIVWPIVGSLVGSLQPTGDQVAQDEFSTRLFYTFFAHHPVAPLLLAFQNETMGESRYPFSVSAAIMFALAFWLVVGLLFFVVACRGIRRALTDKG